MLKKKKKITKKKIENIIAKKKKRDSPRIEKKIEKKIHLCIECVHYVGGGLCEIGHVTNVVTGTKQYLECALMREESESIYLCDYFSAKKKEGKKKDK